MTEQQELTLEGYRNLSFWNKHDAQAVLSFDKIFLPASIGASILSLAREPSSYIFVFVGSWLLLTFWLLLSWRYRKRIEDRFSIIKRIERYLGFKAHLLISDKLPAPQDIRLRFFFYVLAVILGAVPLLLQWLTC